MTPEMLEGLQRAMQAYFDSHIASLGFQVTEANTSFHEVAPYWLGIASVRDGIWGDIIIPIVQRPDGYRASERVRTIISPEDL